MRIPNLWIWLLFGIAAMLLLFRLGAAPVYILDEAKNAQCAREMWAAGNWIVPTFNGELRTDKPVLHYWFMASAYALWGTGPAQARLFSALFGLLTLFVTWSVVRRVAGHTAGFGALLALTLSPHFLFEFRLSVPDPYLIFFTASGMLAGFLYLERQKPISLLLCALLLGLATLSKGPVALALPGLTLVLYAVFSGCFLRELTRPWVYAALLIAVCVALPWFWMVHTQTDGAFTRGFFLDHNLNRFSGSKEGHGGPFILTPLMAMAGMLPFSFLLFQPWQVYKKYLQQPLFRFSAIAVAVYIVFFSVSSTKLPNYAMPCYPFLAIMAGYLLQPILGQDKPFSGRLHAAWTVFFFLLIIGSFIALAGDADVAHEKFLALVFIPGAACSVLAWMQHKKNRMALAMVAASWILLSAALLWVAYPAVYKNNPVGAIQKQLQGKDVVLTAYKMYNPAVNFQMLQHGETIPVFTNLEDLQAFADRFPGKEVMVITRKEFLEKEETAKLQPVYAQKDLFELPTSVLCRILR